MDKFLKYIPGFRTGVTWKKAIAIIYYLFALLMLAAAGFGAFLFFAAAPFVVFSFADLIRSNRKSIPLKKAAIAFILSLAVAIIGLAAFPNSEGTKEPSQIVQENQTPEQPANTETEAKVEDAKPTEQKNSVIEKTDTSEKPQESSQAPIEQNSNIEKPQNNNSQQKDASSVPVTKELKVHFLDVGQADSILIQTPTGENMLIDAGNNADGTTVVSYLKNQGISKIDILVGTHPHEDHIGGMDNVINSFDIGQIYMPKVEHTTKTYEDVLTTISNKGLKPIAPTPGSTFNLGETKFTILAPNSSSYEDLNNYSIVLKMEYGNTSFLFAGDAEDVSEQEMLNKGYDLSADVLKIGHHGSSSSTTQAFLSKVNPKYAVIMVGADNNYGHPAQETMDKLKAANITVYRTDECGTIIATTDGENITFNTKPGSYASRDGGSTASNNTGGTVSTSSNSGSTSSSNNDSEKETTKPSTSDTSSSTSNDRIVYWTPKGKSYHFSKDCPTLSRSKTILSGPLPECPKSDPCDRCTY